VFERERNSLSAWLRVYVCERKKEGERERREQKDRKRVRERKREKES